MSVQSTLARARAFAAGLFVDACEITRPTGAPGPVNPDTGDRTPAPTVTVYAGECKVQTYEPHESARKTGGHQFIEQRYHLHVPVGVGPVLVGDTVTVTAVANDTRLVGRTYRVAGLHHKTWATAQRLLLDEVTG